MSYHLWRLAPGFQIWVDFFFVLSGFVLAPKLCMSNPVSPRTFLMGRVKRIYPALLPLFFILIITTKYTPISKHLDKLGTHHPSIISYLAAFFLLQTFYAPLIVVSPALWSLSAELLANIIAAFFRSKKAILYFIVVGLLFEVFGSFIDLELRQKIYPIEYLIAIGRVLVGFNLGLLLRLGEDTRPRNFKIKKLALILTLLLTVHFLCSVNITAIFFAAPIFYLLLMEITKINENTFPPWFSKLCAYLGRVSYGIYIWHSIVIKLAIQVFILKVSGLHLSGFLKHFFSGAVELTLVLLACEISNRYFEGPLMRYLERRFNM
jgi:peptidoglycan/LPS O-acetylase OafA/YrhL